MSWVESGGGRDHLVQLSVAESLSIIRNVSVPRGVTQLDLEGLVPGSRYRVEIISQAGPHRISSQTAIGYTGRNTAPLLSPAFTHCLDAHSPPAPSFTPKLNSVLNTPGLSPVTLFLSRSPSASSFPVCQSCQHGLGSGCALGDCSRAQGWIPAQRARGGLFCSAKDPGSREGQHQCHRATAGARNMLPCWDLGSGWTLPLPPREHHQLHRSASVTPTGTGISVGTWGEEMRGGEEEGTLAWFLVKLACSHGLSQPPCTKMAACSEVGLFLSDSCVCFSSQFLLHQQT